MAALDVGRVCIKTAGREAGKYCVVINKINDNFVSVTGPKVLTGVKRRRCNIEHLEPTGHMLKIKLDASENDVIDGYKAANLLAKLGLGKPSPEIIKEAEKKAVKVEEKREVKEEKPEKKVEKPKEEKKVEAPKKEKLKPKRGIRGKEEKMPEKAKPKKK